MKVAELGAGLLVQPKAGMKWVKRFNTLCVEAEKLDARSWCYTAWGKEGPVDMGREPVMFIEKVAVNDRAKSTSLERTWGAQVVIIEGRLIGVDGNAGRHIEPVGKEGVGEGP